MNTAAAVAIQRNPFPGLRPFREDEEYLFFGRESQVDAMVNRLATTHFLAVVGTSGSGKSSLTNCGLRPALHGGLMARAGTAWRMAQFRPGSDPLGAMARALAEDGVLFRDYQAAGLTLAEIVDTTLRMSKLGLVDIYQQAQLGEDVNLLLVVDQFEELFRYRQLGAGQQEDVYGVSEAAIAFVNLLLEAKNQTTYPIYVVLTMRSDFLGDCAQFPGLAEAINAGQYLVPRMTRDERRAAISGPVGVGGAEISPVLLTRLVNDVGDNPDQLSILQHALNRTWARWRNEGGGEGPLDLAHYQAIGTMAHALDQHAEQAYAQLDTARQRQICEKLFKALTDKATDPRGVRRPTKLGTLSALADATQAEVTDVIDVFRDPSRSFLMPPAGEVLEAQTVIDISHESLMRVWQRLNRWADEEARSAQIYRRLAETSILHAEGKAALWQDPDLQLALEWREHNQPNDVWAGRYHPEFASAMRFLKESVAERERLKKEKEEQRQRELMRARKIAWGAAAFSLLLLVISGFAIHAYYRAAKSERAAEEGRIDALVDTILLSPPATAGEQMDILADAATSESLRKYAIQKLQSSLEQPIPIDASQDERNGLANFKANLAVALLRLGAVEKAGPYLKHTDGQEPFDTTLRTHVIHRFAEAGADPERIVDALGNEKEPSISQALILSLGEFDATTITKDRRETLVPTLEQIYRNNADAGVHAAAEWLLRQWGQHQVVADIKSGLAGKDQDDRNWYVSEYGLTMVAIPAGTFQMGSPDSDTDASSDETPQHPVTVSRFYLSQCEITQEQYQGLMGENPSHHEGLIDGPVEYVTWFDAVAFCNKLSEREGLPAYYALSEVQRETGGTTIKSPEVTIAGGKGYRLPTESEWEYACRAGTTTKWSCGDDETRLGEFAWYSSNTKSESWPVAGRKPNLWGLFDMHGNVWEWCWDLYRKDYSQIDPDDPSEPTDERENSSRVLRGGSFGSDAGLARAACRVNCGPGIRLLNVGFRVARTYP